jgi:hypothetical protein
MAKRHGAQASQITGGRGLIAFVVVVTLLSCSRKNSKQRLPNGRQHRHRDQGTQPAPAQSDRVHLQLPHRAVAS